MSDIHGVGYGNKHEWENKGTEQHYIPEYRATLFICKKCGISFRHFYHVTSDIFEAMKIRGVLEECKMSNE